MAGRPKGGGGYLQRPYKPGDRKFIDESDGCEYNMKYAVRNPADGLLVHKKNWSPYPESWLPDPVFNDPTTVPNARPEKAYTGPASNAVIWYNLYNKTWNQVIGDSWPVSTKWCDLF